MCDCAFDMRMRKPKWIRKGNGYNMKELSAIGAIFWNKINVLCSLAFSESHIYLCHICNVHLPKVTYNMVTALTAQLVTINCFALRWNHSNSELPYPRLISNVRPSNITANWQKSTAGAGVGGWENHYSRCRVGGWENNFPSKTELLNSKFTLLTESLVEEEWT